MISTKYASMVKMIRVVISCNTVEQFQVAIKFYENMVKMFGLGIYEDMYLCQKVLYLNAQRFGYVFDRCKFTPIHQFYEEGESR